VPAAMGVGNVPQPSTQAAKSKKVSKAQSKKPTSIVSQKTIVVKPTKSQPEGSDQVAVSGEGRGENQRNPKNKAGEMCDIPASHPVSSQKDIGINKESNTSLVASSQKDVSIENSSQPGTHTKRARDTSPEQYSFL
ncbi:hypothetical protein A2U01_0056943, partial [Trifolium medium]|nr:hypothetical protein [Trifolium medium]